MKIIEKRERSQCSMCDLAGINRYFNSIRGEIWLLGIDGARESYKHLQLLYVFLGFVSQTLEQSQTPSLPIKSRISLRDAKMGSLQISYNNTDYDALQDMQVTFYNQFGSLFSNLSQLNPALDLVDEKLSNVLKQLENGFEQSLFNPLMIKHEYAKRGFLSQVTEIKEDVRIFNNLTGLALPKSLRCLAL